MVIVVALLVLCVGLSSASGPYVFLGKFNGKCKDDGLYYRDEKSFVFCANGNSYIQPCAPGTKNSPYKGYHSGKKYHYNNFCEINLLTQAYTEKHHGIQKPHETKPTHFGNTQTARPVTRSPHYKSGEDGYEDKFAFRDSSYEPRRYHASPPPYKGSEYKGYGGDKGYEKAKKPEYVPNYEKGSPYKGVQPYEGNNRPSSIPYDYMKHNHYRPGYFQPKGGAVDSKRDKGQYHENSYESTYSDNSYEPKGYDHGQKGTLYYQQPSYRTQQYEPKGHVSNEYEPNRYERKGYEPVRYEQKGYEPKGYEPKGYEPKGYEPNRYEPNRYEPKGYEPKGYKPTYSQYEPKRPSYDSDYTQRERSTSYDPKPKPSHEPSQPKRQHQSSRRSDTSYQPQPSYNARPVYDSRPKYDPQPDYSNRYTSEHTYSPSQSYAPHQSSKQSQHEYPRQEHDRKASHSVKGPSRVRHYDQDVHQHKGNRYNQKEEYNTKVDYKPQQSQPYGQATQSRDSYKPSSRTSGSKYVSHPHGANYREREYPYKGYHDNSFETDLYPSQKGYSQGYDNQRSYSVPSANSHYHSNRLSSVPGYSNRKYDKGHFARDVGYGYKGDRKVNDSYEEDDKDRYESRNMAGHKYHDVYPRVYDKDYEKQ